MELLRSRSHGFEVVIDFGQIYEGRVAAPCHTPPVMSLVYARALSVTLGEAVDLHFLLTAWAKTAARQHEIDGWMMYVLEDNPTLPASLLNSYQPGVFQDDEAVDVVLAELSTEDMFHIWARELPEFVGESLLGAVASQWRARALPSTTASTCRSNSGKNCGI
jgi:hypothetical protein